MEVKTIATMAANSREVRTNVSRARIEKIAKTKATGQRYSLDDTPLELCVPVDDIADDAEEPKIGAAKDTTKGNITRSVAPHMRMGL